MGRCVTVAAVYGSFGGAEPALPCMPYLAWLLRHRSGCAPITRAVLQVLGHAFKHTPNIKAFAEAGGVEMLSMQLLRLPVQNLKR